MNLGAVPVTLNPASVTINGGVLQYTGLTVDSGVTTFSLALTRGITLGPSSGTVNIPNAMTGTFATNEAAAIFAGPITGSGGLTVTGGAGTNSSSNPYLLELGASNTYTGTTTINNATVSFWNKAPTVAYPNALPATTVLNLVNNGWFVMCNGAANQTIAGLMGDATGLLGTTNGGNPDLLTIVPAVGQTYDYAGVIGDLTLPGKVGASAVSLTISGSGTQILSGPNTYAGATTITSGTLQLGDGGATGTLATASAITDNGTLVFDRNNAVTQGVDFSGATINGTGSVAQIGSGMTVLAANNGYNGGTYVSAGTLQLGHANSLGNGGLTANGGVLDLNGNSPAGFTTFKGIAGVITNTNATPATLSVAQGIATTFSGTFQDGGGSVGLTINSGTLTLLGNNTNSGPTSVLGGVLIAGLANTLSSSSAVTINGGVLDLTAGSQAVAGLTVTSGALNLNINN